MFAWLDGIRRYAVFQGRSTRSQYWLFCAGIFVFALVALFLDTVLGTTYPKGGGIILTLLYLAHVIPAISVQVRRLHDIDRTGWWVWIGLIPVLGQIILFVFACMSSTPGANRFGPPVTDAHRRNLSSAGPTEPVFVNGQPSTSAVEQLERLASLRASGAIDESEFQKLKSSVMSK